MSNYTTIHAQNNDAYTAITNAPNYMAALSETGLHGMSAYTLRKLYAKKILGNRINPSTKFAINDRFAQAWKQARAAANLPIITGDLNGGLAPRHWAG